MFNAIGRGIKSIFYGAVDLMLPSLEMQDRAEPDDVETTINEETGESETVVVKSATSFLRSSTWGFIRSGFYGLCVSFAVTTVVLKFCDLEKIKSVIDSVVDFFGSLFGQGGEAAGEAA